MNPTFWIEHQLWGLNPLAYRCANILLHALNSLLLFRIVKSLNAPGAYLAGFLFAVHPVHVESVAWIIERKDVLSAVFCLLSTYFFLCYTDTARRYCYFISVISFMLAILSKSITISLPVTLILLWWLKRPQTQTVRLLPALLPFLLISLLCAFNTIFAQNSVGPGNRFRPLLDRMFLASRGLWFYFEKLIYPVDLVTLYPKWDLQPDNIANWLYLLLTIVLSITLYVLKDAYRGFCVSVLCYIVTLIPILGFCYYSFQDFAYVADRFQYLASASLIALAAVMLSKWSESGRQSKRIAVRCGTVFGLCVFAFLGWRQAGLYRNPEDLWHATLRENPKCYVALTELGLLNHRRGEIEHAIDFYDSALDVDPKGRVANLNLMLAFLHLGDEESSRVLFERLCDLYPWEDKPWFIFGKYFERKGNEEEALLYYSEALRRNWNNAYAHLHAAQCLEGLGLIDEASHHRKEALRIDPGLNEFPEE